MAAPTLVIATPAHDNLSTNISTFNWVVHNTAAAGDVAVIAVGVNAGATAMFTGPSGWTGVGSMVNTSGNHNTQLWGKVLVAGDVGSTVTVTASAAAKLHGGGIIVRGAKGIPTVFATATDTTTGATVDGPSLTTTDVDNLIANIAMIRNTTVVNAKATTTVSTGWTSRTDSGTANSIAPNFNCSIATRNTIQATAGAVTGATYTSSDTAATGHVWGLAFEPSATNVAPTVNAGADQVDIEPYSTVTLTFSATDPDGTISSYNVTQTAGTTTTRSTPSTNVRTYTAPATLTGETETFSVTAVDNLGAASTADTVNVSVLPASLQYPRSGVRAPTRIVVPGVSSATTRGLGYIGDGLTDQGAGSVPLRKILLNSGWPDSQLEVDGLNHRVINVAGITQPNVGDVIDRWRGGGFDPYTWCIDLGAHNDAATDAAWTGWITGVVDRIASGTRPAYLVYWVGISFATTASDTRATRFLAVLRSMVGKNAKISFVPIDWNSYIHNGRSEAGLWADPADTGRYMTTAGYALRNAYVAGQIGTPT